MRLLAWVAVVALCGAMWAVVVVEILAKVAK